MMIDINDSPTGLSRSYRSEQLNYLIVVPRLVNKAGDYYMFPAGIAYISAALKKAGFNLYKLNLNRTDLPAEEIVAAEISRNDIDVLLTGGLTGQYGSIHSILAASRKARQDIINIVGGGIITSSPGYAMKALEHADFGVIGEGELVICQLCEALQDEGRLTDVPSIVYKTGDSYTISSQRQESIEIDQLPFPDYDDYGLEELMALAPNIIGISEDKTFNIFTSRGCPYNCTFCFYTTGRRYRQHNLDRVFSEIDYYVGRFGVKYLSIQDELFGHNMDRIKEFCRRIKPYNINWFAQFRVNDITPELVEMLRDSKCRTIGFGIESADNRVLQSMNKKITIEDTNRALRIVYNAGIGIQGCLIFGDIAETTETVTKSLKWWNKHIQYGIQLHVVGTYPGTKLFHYAMENGLISDPVQFIRDSCPTVRLSGMTDQEYVWMLGQILSIQRVPECQPNSISSICINHKQQNMSVTGVCRSCNTVNTWDKVRLFIAESLMCKQCGRRHYSPIPDNLVENVSSGLNDLQQKYGTVCFWGINSFFYGLSEKLSINKVHFRCVDKSSIRHDMPLFGMRVEDPEVIARESIRCIVVTVPQYYPNIAPMINVEFPETESIVNINSLIYRH
jgi:anaerobic magnesium-protoporphyrin IX monomethyl ester cyclase